MNKIKQQVERRIQQLESLCEAKQKAMAKAPDGHLRIHKRGNSARYYWVTDQTGPNGKYMRKESDYITRNGFTLGVNLIVTMETRDQPLDPDIIQSTINHFLL